MITKKRTELYHGRVWCGLMYGVEVSHEDLYGHRITVSVDMTIEFAMFTLEYRFKLCRFL